MNKKSKKSKDNNNSGAIVSNRKAFHQYAVLESIEAGIALQGTEVKSCRAGTISLTEAYAKIIDNELFLLQCNISPYDHGNRFNHDPDRPKKLLIHKHEIKKLKRATEAKGLTVIPLKIYLTRGKIKVQLGICRGKDSADKRHTIKQRQDNIDARRAMKNLR